MKKLLCFLSVFFFLQTHLEAQIINKLSVDFNVFRRASEMGVMAKLNRYPHINTIQSGINIGYNASEKWQYYVGIRRLKTEITGAWLDSSESTNRKGAEVMVGAKISPNSHKKVYLSYGLEIFEEFSSQEGNYWDIAFIGPSFVINHRTNHFGIAPIATINVKLFEDKIIFFANSRFRLGYVSINPDITFVQVRNNYWSFNYEPINAIGLRFKLDCIS